MGYLREIFSHAHDHPGGHHADALLTPDRRSRYAGPWDENKHPRGQPENAGEFGPGGGGGQLTAPTPAAAISAGAAMAASVAAPLPAGTAVAEPPKQGQSWTEHHERAMGLLEAGIASAEGLPEARRRGYARAARWVVGRMPEGFAKAFAERLQSARFLGDLRQVTDECRRRGTAIREGSVVAGFVDHGRSTRDPAMVLDGGFDPERKNRQRRSGWGLSRLAEVYAHEFAHVVDRHFSLSGDPSWYKPWGREMAGGQLSRYGATDATEGFAEFGRLVAVKGIEYAREHFPSCTESWEKAGLL